MSNSTTKADLVVTATPQLSVVMPCYNEERTVSEVVGTVLKNPAVGELIVIDDASTDSSWQILSSLADDRIRLARHEFNLGKGASIAYGISMARFPFTVIQDADLEYNPDEYQLLLGPLLADKADVVFGSRFHTNRPHRVLYYWHSVGNKLLTIASNMVSNVNLTDMETCYKMGRTELLQQLQLQEDRFGVEPEMTIKLARHGARIYEVGISYDGRTYAEGKKIGWRDGVRALYCIAKYGLGAKTPSGTASPDATVLDLRDRSSAIHGDPGEATISLITANSGNAVVNLGFDVVDQQPVLRAHPSAADSTTEPNRTFDTAVLVNVLEYAEDEGQVLSEAANLVGDGGRILLSVPTSSRSGGLGPEPFRCYTSSSIRRLIAQNGLYLEQLEHSGLQATVDRRVTSMTFDAPGTRWLATTVGKLLANRPELIQKIRGGPIFCVASVAPQGDMATRPTPT